MAISSNSPGPVRALLGWSGLLLCAPLLAGNPVTEIHVGDVPKGTVALGAGWRFGDSPYKGLDDVGSVYHDNSYDLMPFYFYEGDWLFSHGSTAGVHVFENETFRFDGLISYRFNRLESEQDDYFSTVEDREQTLEAGVSAAVRGGWGELSLELLGDTLGRHRGEEASLSYRQQLEYGDWTFSPFVSYIYQDSDLTDYYYGVSEAESRPDLPAYTPGSSAFWRVGLNSSYHWSKRMWLFANVGVDQLDDPVRDSPLVDEDFLPSAMVGFAYAFGNLSDSEAATRRDPKRFGEWSWRINYGYTAEETFHRVHRGEIKKNEDVNTDLVGLTLGKLILDGKRADFWAKASLNRRLEHEYQDDFYEINAYVMAMGTGYSPWTNRELFRYGFGYGFSYADSIPQVERVKQEKRGENTSHFLNYLEAQIDFPLRNLFSRGPLSDCYAGLTIVHRSGIFGQVDILGNVSGGSDVLTAHMECKR